MSAPPCVLFEDDHLLVVNKPPGWNTHAPSPFAGEGIYDWLKHREPRWASLAIVHRLDKETSGVMVFGKTPLANRSLTEQFARRAVRKEYVLLTERKPRRSRFTVKSSIIRVGDHYATGVRGELAETRFEVRNPQSEFKMQSEATHVGCYEVLAEPLTGRTHQIRVHAAENGFPILGDVLYGARGFGRVCLHAGSLAFTHPASRKPVAFEAKPEFDRHWSDLLLRAMLAPSETNAFRTVHGATGGTPGFYMDALGNYVLVQSDRALHPTAETPDGFLGTYLKILTRRGRDVAKRETCPKLVHGQSAPERFEIRENGVKFELSFHEGRSVGLFLDQRDNRRRLLTGHVAAEFELAAGWGERPCEPTVPSHGSSGASLRRTWELLNCFAYTCGFSVCAALAGSRTTSLDLSKKSLEWGKRNFSSNGLEPAAHDFIFGDAFDWLRRLAKKKRAFHVVLLDPPTFSRSKEQGVFRAEKDYGKLVSAALPVLKPGGVLFCSTNAADWPPENFLASVRAAVGAAGRRIVQEHYAPQPPDFPVSRAEPAYLKTAWLRVS